MYQSILLGVSILLLLLGSSGRTDEKLAYFLAGGFEKGGGVDWFFESMTPSQVSAFRYHPNLKVAAYAAWFDCWRKSLSSGDANGTRYRDEFIGFLSARLEMELPEWWSEELRKVRFDDNFPTPPGTPSDVPKGFMESSGVRHEVGVELNLRKEEFSFSQGDYDVKIFRENFVRGHDGSDEDRSEPLEMFGDLPNAFAGTFHSSGRFVFAVSDKVEEGFRVYCANEDGGARLWVSEVCSHRQGRSGFGNNGRGRLSIRVTDKIACVFWEVKGDLMIDAFNLENGVPVARFSVMVELPKLLKRE